MAGDRCLRRRADFARHGHDGVTAACCAMRCCRLAVIVIAAGEASLGHAADAGLASAAIAMQTLHVLVTTVWGGLAITAGLVALPALGASTARGDADPHGDAGVERVAGRGRVRAAVRHLQRGAGFRRIVAWRSESSARGHVLILKLTLCRTGAGAWRTEPLPGAAAPPRRTASTMDAHTFVNVLYRKRLR